MWGTKQITEIKAWGRPWKIFQIDEGQSPWPDNSQHTVVHLRRGSQVKTKEFKGHIGWQFDVHPDFKPEESDR